MSKYTIAIGQRNRHVDLVCVYACAFFVAFVERDREEVHVFLAKLREYHLELNLNSCFRLWIIRFFWCACHLATAFSVNFSSHSLLCVVCCICCCCFFFFSLSLFSFQRIILYRNCCFRFLLRSFPPYITFRSHHHENSLTNIPIQMILVVWRPPVCIILEFQQSNKEWRERKKKRLLILMDFRRT